MRDIGARSEIQTGVATNSYGGLSVKNSAATQPKGKAFADAFEVLLRRLKEGTVSVTKTPGAVTQSEIRSIEPEYLKTKKFEGGNGNASARQVGMNYIAREFASRVEGADMPTSRIQADALNMGISDKIDVNTLAGASKAELAVTEFARPDTAVYQENASKGTQTPALSEDAFGFAKAEISALLNLPRETKPLSSDSQGPGFPVIDEVLIESAPPEALPVSVDAKHGSDEAVMRGWTEFLIKGAAKNPNMVNSETFEMFSTEKAAFATQQKMVAVEGLWAKGHLEEGTLGSEFKALPGVSFEAAFPQTVNQQVTQPVVTSTVEVGRELLIDQIVQGVRAAQTSESAEILVHLKPDFLGRMTIRVLAEENGMRVEIRAENEVVRQVMQDNLADLQQRLAEKGFAFSQFSILADTGRQSQREAEWPFEFLSGETPTKSDTAAENAVESVQMAHNNAIDYLA